MGLLGSLLVLLSLYLYDVQQTWSRVDESCQVEVEFT
jgi:hypothetical protein